MRLGILNAYELNCLLGVNNSSIELSQLSSAVDHCFFISNVLIESHVFYCKLVDQSTVCKSWRKSCFDCIETLVEWDTPP